MKNQKMLDKFKGSILGVAIGDALGYPVEFMSVEEIKDQYGKNGITGYNFNELNLPEGKYSDDTQMTLALGQALVDSKSDEVEEIMKNVSKRFLEWRVSPENDRAPGCTCMQGLSNLISSKSWKTSGLDSLGCGSAMRVAPIGLLYYDNPEKLKEIASASSIITHNSPTAIASAIANAYLVSRALQGQDPTNLEALLQFTDNLSPKFTQKIKQIYDVKNYTPETALNTLGQGWHGHEAVALALYCLQKNSMDFEKSVIMAANTEGDSDSIASIAAGIAGAYHGYDNLPKRFLRGLENRKRLFSLALDLYKKKFEN